ncbi:hypothetical protein BH10ACT1_BH10ACT1_41240 [soil metagenome]
MIATLGAMASPEDLSTQHRVWEDWAQADPLWAILSDPAQKGGKWDLGEFFASGHREIEVALAEVAAQGLELRKGRALDFGCGVGRLTLALGAVFDRADGVDISETMVDLAREHNDLGDRVEYHVNLAPDLALFPDDSFDFVFSTIVLQHNPPDAAARYIEEFGRVLAPGGIAVFDMTAALTGASLPPGSHTAAISLVTPPRMVPEEATAVTVTVTNTSRQDWPAGTRLAIGNHWRSADGSEMLVQDDARHPLPGGLAAGAATSADLAVTVPGNGSFTLEVDLVEEGACWFAQNASPTALAPVRGGAPSRSLRDRLTGRRAAPDPEVAALADEPEPFAMNGLPREEVEAAVGRSGCRVVHVAASGSGGSHWDGFRYTVRNDG